MATVRMRKGDKFADIFDSEETIANAKKEGWELAEGAGSKGKGSDAGKEAGDDKEGGVNKRTRNFKEND